MPEGLIDASCDWLQYTRKNIDVKIIFRESQELNANFRGSYFHRYENFARQNRLENIYTEFSNYLNLQKLQVLLLVGPVDSGLPRASVSNGSVKSEY